MSFARQKSPVRGRARAFSLVEMLVTILLFTIVGGAVVTSFRSFFVTYWQTEDYAMIGEEIDRAFAKLSMTIRNVGLGLPSASLDVVFHAESNNPPESIMSKLRYPLVVTNDQTSGSIIQESTATRNGETTFEGPVLYYVWSEPTDTLIHYILGDDDSTLLGDAKCPDSTTYGSYYRYSTLQDYKGFWTGDDLDLRALSQHDRETLSSAIGNIVNRLKKCYKLHHRE